MSWLKQFQGLLDNASDDLDLVQRIVEQAKDRDGPFTKEEEAQIKLLLDKCKKKLVQTSRL